MARAARTPEARRTAGAARRESVGASAPSAITLVATSIFGDVVMWWAVADGFLFPSPHNSYGWPLWGTYGVLGLAQLFPLAGKCLGFSGVLSTTRIAIPYLSTTAYCTKYVRHTTQHHARGGGSRCAMCNVSMCYVYMNVRIAYIHTYGPRLNPLQPQVEAKPTIEKKKCAVAVAARAVRVRGARAREHVP